MKRIIGLDAIRVICAMFVVLGHFPPHLDWGTLRGTIGPIATLVSQLIGVAFNGPAAVIIFFIVSGFCIHLPYAEGKPFYAREYYLRRYVRIVPPVMVAIILYKIVDYIPEGNWNIQHTVLWSVICELIYYTIYPLILRWSRYLKIITIFSYVLTFLIIFVLRDFFVSNKNYNALGYWTFVVGLPVWLSGCVVATNYRQFWLIVGHQRWALRCAIYWFSTICLIAKFHFPQAGFLSSSTFTLTLFAIAAYFWIGVEVRAFAARETESGALAWLDRLGQSSYSLYLVHVVALYAIHMAAAELGQDILAWLIYLCSAAAATAVFFFLVERPSHRLARATGRWATGRKAMNGRMAEAAPPV